MGIMLGNYKEIAKMLRVKGIDESSELFAFQKEIGFLVRTFYFVYMGSLVVIGGTGALVMSVAIMVGLIIARWISSQIATFRSDLAEYKSYINIMMPRGLATAVMSGYPALLLYQNRNAIAASAYNYLSGQANMFVEISFFVIIISVILTAIGLFVLKRMEIMNEEHGKSEGKGEEKPAAEAEKPKEEG
jgi:cell volume regulation protein A